MKTPRIRPLLVAALVLFATALVSIGTRRSPQQGACCASLFSAQALATDAPAVVASATAAPQPRLVELGASRCVPCKMMAPILEGLKKEYTGRMQVDFIDVWQNPDAGKQYGIRMIPTQLFFDSAGKELFRHEGFFAKEDILAKWKELGIKFGEKKEAL